MKAIDLRDDQLVWVDMAPPTLQPGCVRLDVHTAGVNRADLVQRAGRYAPPPGASPILGLEACGVVTEVAPDVDDIQVGEVRCALLAGGGYAEQVVVRAGHTLPLPSGCSMVEGAGLMEVFATAWLNVVDLPGLLDRPGARVLLHAGASGVGTAALQIARELGLRTFVTVGTQEKIDRCVALGAEGGANRKAGPWLDAVKAWAPDGVDAILDPVGASYLDDNLSALARDGSIVHIGLLSGRRAELDMGKMLMKRARLQGSTLRARSSDFKTRLVKDLEDHLWSALSERRITPIIHGTYAIEDVQTAHEVLASNTTLGQLVLEVPRAS